jgi:hypothetical protein
MDADWRLNFQNVKRIFPSMNLTDEQVVERALALPSEERALLADRLVESLDPAEIGRFREMWITEARRRRQEVRENQVKTIPRGEVLARVKRAVAK